MRNKTNLIQQDVLPSILAGIAVVLVFYIFTLIDFDLKYGNGSSTIIFAALGVSAYLLNVSPEGKYSKIENTIFAYIICAVIGFLCTNTIQYVGIILAAGIAVSVTAIVMSVFKREHPPAIGYALAFVLYDVSINGIAIVLLLGFLVISVSLLLRAIISRILGYKFTINYR